MKICVYAICKNEEKFAVRWLKSMREADGIYVLDTGSTDRTVQLLTDGGAFVTQQRISPWRFDAARNLSLSLVPEDADVCVCTDLDEVFDPGWRDALEKSVRLTRATQIRYKYVWSVTEDGKEGVVFWADKIHSRHGFVWTHPVHEVIVPQPDTVSSSAYAQGVRLVHLPDHKKSRAQYLPLLELSVAESPQDDRNMHYLGREYMYAGQNEKAVQTLTNHLALPSAVWREERSASMRYIGVCLDRMGKPDEASGWFLKAIAESPETREPYLYFAKHAYQHAEWHAVIWAVEKMEKITAAAYSYISEPECRGPLPYDMLSMAYYYTGQKEKAVQAAQRALGFGEDKRIRKNLEFFR